jgi:hypothetical protein
VFQVTLEVLNSVAGLLLTLPSELLMVVVGNAPLSAVAMGLKAQWRKQVA